MGWREVYNAELPSDTVLQLWSPWSKAESGGLRGVISLGFYLDQLLSTEVHYQNDPHNWITSEETRKNLLGGEACMWTESTTPHTIDSRIWPRNAAVAERLWSPADVEDFDDFSRRLEIFSQNLERLGLTHDSYYEPALAEFTGGKLEPAVKTLADISLAPGIGEAFYDFYALAFRFAPELAKRNLQTPPVDTRLEHSFQVQSPVADQFGDTVDEYLSNPQNARKQLAEIRSNLEMWRDNHAAYVELSYKYEALKPLLPISEGIRDLAIVGLASLDVLEGSRSLTEREIAQQLEIIDWYDSARLISLDTDFGEFESPAEGFALIFSWILQDLETMRPLIVHRVMIAIEPAIENLAKAAHDVNSDR